jgi:hypothetical protein
MNWAARTAVLKTSSAAPTGALKTSSAARANYWRELTALDADLADHRELIAEVEPSV